MEGKTMQFKVLYTSGDDVYIVQKDKAFYLVNLEVDTPPIKKDLVESFVKFGYFTAVDEIDSVKLSQIEAKLSSNP